MDICPTIGRAGIPIQECSNIDDEENRHDVEINSS